MLSYGDHCRTSLFWTRSHRHQPRPERPAPRFRIPGSPQLYAPLIGSISATELVIDAFSLIFLRELTLVVSTVSRFVLLPRFLRSFPDLSTVSSFL